MSDVDSATPLRIAILGYGNVGSALAVAFARAGHHVTIAVNSGRPDGAAAVIERHPELAGAEVADAERAVTTSDLVVLAVPFAALDDLLPPLAPHLDGTIVIDATNPVGPGLTHGLGSTQAGSQYVADRLPGAHVVKAFSIYGYENLTAPTGAGDLRPAMLYAGDDVTAKAWVGALLDGLGWEPIDAGGLGAALDLEHMTLLWVRLVRVMGHDPRLLWAALR